MKEYKIKFFLSLDMEQYAVETLHCDNPHKEALKYIKQSEKKFRPVYGYIIVETL